MPSCGEARLRSFEHFFAFRWVSLPHVEWKFITIELPVTFLPFGCLYLGILGFESEQYFCPLDFCIFNLRRPAWFVCLVYSLRSNIFFRVLFSYYRTPEKRTKWALNYDSWNTIYLKIIGLFGVFLMYNFHFSCVALYYFVTRQRNYLISSF